MKKQAKAKPDWKKIAVSALNDIEWAIEFLAARDGLSGNMINRETGKTRHWKERFADTLEMVPGSKVDREAMFACGLPRKQRQKWFADREKAKKSEGRRG